MADIPISCKLVISADQEDALMDRGLSSTGAGCFMDIERIPNLVPGTDSHGTVQPTEDVDAVTSEDRASLACCLLQMEVHHIPPIATATSSSGLQV